MIKIVYYPVSFTRFGPLEHNKAGSDWGFDHDILHKIYFLLTSLVPAIMQFNYVVFGTAHFLGSYGLIKGRF